MMTKYSPLKQFAAFGFAAMVLAVPRQATQQVPVRLLPHPRVVPAALRHPNIWSKMLAIAFSSRQTGRFLMLHLAAPWCVRPNG